MYWILFLISTSIMVLVYALILWRAWSEDAFDDEKPDEIPGHLAIKAIREKEGLHVSRVEVQGAGKPSSGNDAGNKPSLSVSGIGTRDIQADS